VIWVEFLSRHRDVASRVRISGEEVNIGRGYDNDVIVDDPYVAARHLRVFRGDAGQLLVEDLESTNGTFLDGSKDRITRLAIDGGQPIRIGQTLLRVRASDYAVEPERVEPAERHVLPAVLVAALVAAVFGFILLRVWLAQTGEPRLSNYVTPVLWVAAMVLAWVGIWALLSRILAGRSYFLRNLLIAFAGFLTTLIYNEFAKYAAFALTWSAPSTYEYAAVWSMLAGACFLHLRQIGATRLWLKGAMVTAALVVAIGTQTLQRSEAFSDFGRQNAARLFLPPAFRAVSLHASDAFFAGVVGLKVGIDADRRQARSGEAAR
jgi:pSer/pThr/pTyr-binding forkhead associated (FHA) protein